MSTIYIILNEDGKLESVHSTDEVKLEVLKKGKNDARIDYVESVFETLELG